MKVVKNNISVDYSMDHIANLRLDDEEARELWIKNFLEKNRSK